MNKRKIGLGLLWLTILGALAIPPLIYKREMLVFAGLYIFCTWIVFLMSLILDESAKQQIKEDN